MKLLLTSVTIAPNTMKKAPKNPNDHKRVTPSTKGSNDDKRFTSYDTRRKETSTPQKIREGNESAAEQARSKKAGKSS